MPQTSRRAKGEGTAIHKTKSGKFNAYISLGEDSTGKRVRRSVTGKTRAEVSEKIRDLRAEFDRAGNRHLLESSRQTTVQDALDAYVRHQKAREKSGRIKARTVEYAEQSTARCAGLAAVRVNKLTPQDVEDWTETLTGSQSGKRGAWLALRSALTLARRNGITTNDPMKDLEPPSPPKLGDAPYATEDEVAAILAKAEEPWRTMWLFMAYTGVRTGEARGLRWEHVGKDTVQIWSSGPDADDTKTEAGMRTIPMVPRVKDALDDIRQESGFVFPFAEDRSKTNREFRKVAPRGLTPKSLRHGVATRLLLDGTPEHVVAQILGHSTPAITKRIYAHSVATVEAAALSRLAGSDGDEWDEQGE